MQRYTSHATIQYICERRTTRDHTDDPFLSRVSSLMHTKITHAIGNSPDFTATNEPTMANCWGLQQLCFNAETDELR